METLLASLPQGLDVALGTLARPALFSHWPSRIGTTSKQGSSFVLAGLWSWLQEPPYHTRGHQRHEGLPALMPIPRCCWRISHRL